jgi:hypothetical protein
MTGLKNDNMKFFKVVNGIIFLFFSVNIFCDSKLAKCKPSLLVLIMAFILHVSYSALGYYDYYKFQPVCLKHYKFHI